MVNGIFHSIVLGRFVDDGDTMGVVARRVLSPTAAAQHSQVTYLADGALRVNKRGLRGADRPVVMRRVFRDATREVMKGNIVKLKNLCDDKSRAKGSTIVASLPVKKYGHQRSKRHWRGIETSGESNKQSQAKHHCPGKSDKSHHK